jgi:hypothetical protein
MRMVKFAVGDHVTIELLDGSVFPGLFTLMDDDGVMVERTNAVVDATFVPWHSIKLMNSAVVR